MHSAPDGHTQIRDADPEMENEFFETRQSFLSLCQGNHYQFDTMRRAKHSSMMVLYHIHNPDAPAFASSCNVCHKEMEAGTGLRCTVCPDFDICRDCYNTSGHPHPVTVGACCCFIAPGRASVWRMCSRGPVPCPNPFCAPSIKSTAPA